MSLIGHFPYYLEADSFKAGPSYPCWFASSTAARPLVRQFAWVTAKDGLVVSTTANHRLSVLFLFSSAPVRLRGFSACRQS